MKNIDKKITLTASVLAGITIAIGAFGAHGLKQLVDINAINSFETAVRYQMYHVLAMLFLGFATFVPVHVKKWVFRFFLLGIVLFSGSIYLLALNKIIPFNTLSLGFITPIVGLCFIIAWFRLAFGIYLIK